MKTLNAIGMRYLKPLVLGAVVCFAPNTGWSVDHSSKLDGFLSQGKLSEAAEHFGTLQDDNQARLALGITQFLQGIEGLGQDAYRYGLNWMYARMIPIARIPVAMNPEPESVTYQDVRDVLDRFQTKLETAEATLAKVDTKNVKLSFFIGKVKLDLDGNKEFSDTETLWRLFVAINNGVEGDLARETAESFSVGVDGADVHWLRGYCHVLMGLCDMVLAYDQKKLFERFGHLWFPNTASPYNPSQDKSELDDQNDGDQERMVATILDLVGVVHLMQFELVSPERMATAHGHLSSMIQQSRLSWERAMDEKDNDREWIPNPNQVSVLQLRVGQELITGWHSVLDELEAVLDGAKLIPDWRTYTRSLGDLGSPDAPQQGVGINLKKVFLEPTDFDLILTLQGSNLMPYKEVGPLSTPATWRTLTDVFRGQFFGFAVWFN